MLPEASREWTSCVVQQHPEAEGGIWVHLHMQCVLCQQSAITGRAAVLFGPSDTRQLRQISAHCWEEPFVSEGEILQCVSVVWSEIWCQGCISSWVGARTTGLNEFLPDKFALIFPVFLLWMHSICSMKGLGLLNNLNAFRYQLKQAFRITWCVDIPHEEMIN